MTELETRVAFQEQGLAELSDALAAARADSARMMVMLRQISEELARGRGSLLADPADEPPPPHY